MSKRLNCSRKPSGDTVRSNSHPPGVLREFIHCVQLVILIQSMRTCMGSGVHVWDWGHTYGNGGTCMGVGVHVWDWGYMCGSGGTYMGVRVQVWEWMYIYGS